MKTKTFLLSLLTIVTLIAVPASAAEINPSITEAVQKAQQAVDLATSTLSNVTALAGKILPTTVSVKSTNGSPTNVVSTVAVPTVTGTGVKATINDAVIDILHGAKTASGEIYQASKTAITKAVDFTIEQAPLVVKEFIHWKLAEAIIYALAWAIPAFILLYIARVFKKRSESADVPKEDRFKTDQNDYSILKWCFRVAALIMLTINLTTHGLTITKICVAPRVYLIEYVVSTVHNGTPPSQ